LQLRSNDAIQAMTWHDWKNIQKFLAAGNQHDQETARTLSTLAMQCGRHCHSCFKNNMVYTYGLLPTRKEKVKYGRQKCFMLELWGCYSKMWGWRCCTFALSMGWCNLIRGSLYEYRCILGVRAAVLYIIGRRKILMGSLKCTECKVDDSSSHQLN